MKHRKKEHLQFNELTDIKYVG